MASPTYVSSVVFVYIYIYIYIFTVLSSLGSQTKLNIISLTFTPQVMYTKSLVPCTIVEHIPITLYSVTKTEKGRPVFINFTLWPEQRMREVVSHSLY